MQVNIIMSIALAIVVYLAAARTTHTHKKIAHKHKYFLLGARARIHPCRTVRGGRGGRAQVARGATMSIMHY